MKPAHKRVTKRFLDIHPHIKAVTIEQTHQVYRDRINSYWSVFVHGHNGCELHHVYDWQLTCDSLRRALHIAYTKLMSQ